MISLSQSIKKTARILSPKFPSRSVASSATAKTALTPALMAELYPYGTKPISGLTMEAILPRLEVENEDKTYQKQLNK